MQQSHIPTREQSDSSLVQFFSALGHRPPSTLTFHANPRLSDRPVHADLSSTVIRMRSRTAITACPKAPPGLIGLPDESKARSERIANRIMVAVFVAFASWFAIPVAVAAVAGKL